MHAAVAAAAGADLFHASKTGVGMTVSAATLGVALSAPVFGALAERLPRKRVIVLSLLGVSVPTLLAATSTSLAQLIFWRFLQGITVPGIIAVVITYIGEEWPPDQVALIMSFYVSGTALGGFVGRISSGILADRFSWRVSFLVLGAASLAGAAAVAAWLPARTTAARSQPAAPGAETGFIYQVQGLFRSRRLVATFAVGFNVLFSLVGVFTWITFHLSAAPFLLSTTALSSLFFVYLIGLVVTPAAGYLITRVGLRAGIAGAIVCAMAGVLLTLGALAARRHRRADAALHRRLHRPDRLQQPSARRRACRGTRYGCRPLHHLLLPGRRGGRGGSRSILGAGRVAGLRRLHCGHAGRRAGNRPGRLANSRRSLKHLISESMNPKGGETNLFKGKHCRTRGLSQASSGPL